MAVCVPRGFQLAGVHCGLKEDAAHEEQRLTRAVLALAAAQMAETARQAVEPPEQTIYAWPVAVFPNPFIRRHENPFRLPPPGYDPTAIPMERRQPGSLFPIQRRGGLGNGGSGPVSASSSTSSSGSRCWRQTWTSARSRDCWL